MRLREIDGIVSYNEKFESIRTRVQLSEAYLVSAYLAGLRVYTQMHLRMFAPQSIRYCFTLGKLYELAYPKMQGTGTPRPFFKANDFAKKDSVQSTSATAKVKPLRCKDVVGNFLPQLRSLISEEPDTTSTLASSLVSI